MRCALNGAASLGFKETLFKVGNIMHKPVVNFEIKIGINIGRHGQYYLVQVSSNTLGYCIAFNAISKTQIDYPFFAKCVWIIDPCF